MEHAVVYSHLQRKNYMTKDEKHLTVRCWNYSWFIPHLKSLSTWSCHKSHKERYKNNIYSIYYSSIVVSLYLHVYVSGFNVEDLVIDLFYWIEKSSKGEVSPGS